MTGIYHGWTESEESAKNRNLRRQLQEVEYWYGSNWEADANDIHALIAAAESTDKPEDENYFSKSHITVKSNPALLGRYVPTDQRTAAEIDRDMQGEEWDETYKDIRAGL